MGKFLVWLVFSFISTFSFAYLYYKLNDLNGRLSLKVKIFFVFGVVIVALVEHFHIEVISSLLYFIYFPILFYLMNKLSIKKLFYYVFIVWFYGIIADILTILLTSLVFFVFNININIYTNYSDSVSIFLSFCVSIFLIVLSRIKSVKTITSKIYQKIDNVKYFDLLLAIFAIFIFCLGFAMFLNIKDLNINVLLSLVIVLMIVTFIVLLKYKINSEENVKYLKILRDNNDFYIKVEDENGLFKHNLIAKLLSIKSVSNDKAVTLIEDLIMQFNKCIDFSNNIKEIPYGLNGIIYQKLYPYSKKLNVKINNEIKYDIFNMLTPRRYNVFVEKIMLALDNAIESSLKSKNNALVLNLYDDEDYICIEIENTFSNNVSIDMIGEKNYSTKGKLRGFGLFSILRNNEANVSVKIVNNIFISKITTKKKHLTENKKFI